MHYDKPKRTNAWRLLLPLLLLTLPGCSILRSKPSSPVVLQIPSQPIASTPQPSQKYSETAERDIKRWDEKLKGTLTTP